MQQFKFLLVSMSLLLLSTADISAQFINVKEPKSRPVKTGTNKTVKTNERKPKVEREAKWKDFNHLYISYATEGIVYDDPTSDDRKFKGINIGRMHSENITNGYFPLYLDYGLEATAVRFHDEEKAEYTEERNSLNYDVKEKRQIRLDLINVAIPVNFTYLLATSNGKYGIAPIVGINFKVNVYGRGKETFTKDYYYLNHKHNSLCTSDISRTDFFDKNDMDDASFKRFQFGMNLGVNLYKGKLVVGYRFQPDFTKVRKGDFPAKTTTNLVSIGTRW